MVANSLASDLCGIVNAECARWSIPGAAVLVVHRGDVVLAQGFGMRNVEHTQPVTPETLFPIGSSTKTFTAALAASLVDDGELEWDVPLRHYMPEFRLWDPTATEQCSMRDALSHRSGLPRHDLLWSVNDGRTREDLLAVLRHLEPSAQFRQRWQYNNLMYFAAGYIAGKLAGGSYEQAVRSRVLDPLDMTRTNFTVEDLRGDADHATPYLAAGDGSIQPIPYSNTELIGPAGCINSCLIELTHWVTALLAVGTENRILSDAALTALTTPTMAMPPEPMHPDGGQLAGYGLGLVIEDYRGVRLVHHGGNIGGFCSQVALCPQTDSAVVVLANLNSSCFRDVLTYLIFDRLMVLAPLAHGELMRERWLAVRAGLDEAKLRHAAKPGGTPVRPLADYAGSYSHPAYGVLEVNEEAGVLHGFARGVTGVIEHARLEVFDFVIASTGTEERIPLRFSHGFDGHVDAAWLPLEPAVGPIRFDKQPAPASDLLIDQVLGRYQMGPFEVRVFRTTNGQLFATFPEEITQRLTYVADRQFRVASMTVTFEPDATLVTPEGVFRRA